MDGKTGLGLIAALAAVSATAACAPHAAAYLASHPPGFHARSFTDAALIDNTDDNNDAFVSNSAQGGDF